MRRLVALAVVTLVLVSACGSAAEDQAFVLEPNIAAVFDAEGVAGTIVVKEIGSDEPASVYDIERAREAFPPAETFRPLANLILLHSETVASLDEEWEWSGDRPYVQDWDRVHSIRTGSAPGANAEWLYVQALEEAGLARVGVWVQRAAYGNQNVGTREGASFWMDGTMLITTYQQAEFMELIFSEGHPFDHYATLDTKDLFTIEKGNDWTIRYVQGRVPGPRTADKVGWLTGIVETENGTWAIAMNTDVHWDRTIDPDKRLRMTVAALTALEIID